jgi:2-dehydro-3-deoxygluconokinase
MKVITFGESLFRTVTQTGERLRDATKLHFYLGGTELNVAANLKSLGIQTTWVSALPAGPSGALIKEKVKHLGVDVSHCVQLNDMQVGWYLMESGAAPRPDLVLHRNAKEAGFSFDWQQIFSDGTLFHCSGITTGLSLALTTEVKNAVTIAKENNLLVSYDLNYRKNIWSLDEFVKRQKDLINYIDILFCSERDLKLFFTDFSDVFTQSNIQILVLTQRNKEHEYGINVITRNSSVNSKLYQIHCIDRIGIGDSAAAGFIKAYLSTQDIQIASEWAALAGALKYGIQGDMALLKEHEITTLLESQHMGIIR